VENAQREEKDGELEDKGKRNLEPWRQPKDNIVFKYQNRQNINKRGGIFSG
jgi:hypothetical protein